MIKELVVAGSYQVYQLYLSQTHKSPIESIYVTREEQIRGRSDITVVLANGYWRSPLYKSGILRYYENQGRIKIRRHDVIEVTE